MCESNAKCVTYVGFQCPRCPFAYRNTAQWVVAQYSLVRNMRNAIHCELVHMYSTVGRAPPDVLN